MNDNYPYRKPLDEMNTKDRCRWYANMLTTLLPEGHRETEAYISLRAFFKFGKLFFRIRRTDDFINYLIEQKLW